MMIHFKRDDIETYIKQNWVNDTHNKFLFIRGSRDVGKTYLARYVAETYLKDYKMYYINFAELDLQSILNYISNGTIKNSIMLLSYLNQNIDLSNRVVFIIDNPNLSPTIFKLLIGLYGYMPYININIKFIFTGTYIDTLKQYSFYPSEDNIVQVDLQPLVFEEFLTGFKMLKDLYISGVINEDKDISYNLSNNILCIIMLKYLKYGGYPLSCLDLLKTLMIDGETDGFDKYAEDYIQSYKIDLIQNAGFMYGNLFIKLLPILNYCTVYLKNGSNLIDIIWSIYKETYDTLDITQSDIEYLIEWLTRYDFIKLVDCLIPTSNSTSNTVKDSKIYFTNPCVMTYLTNKNKIFTRQQELEGQLVELYTNNVLYKLINRSNNYRQIHNTLYLKDIKNNLELDYLLKDNKSDNKYIGLEVKRGSSKPNSGLKCLKLKYITKLLVARCCSTQSVKTDPNRFTLPLLYLYNYLEQKYFTHY